MPGPAYAIEPTNAAHSGATITLLFSPWPGHYDAGVSTTLVAFYGALLQDDRWGRCLAAMAAGAGVDASVKTHGTVFGSKPALQNQPTLTDADRSVGVRAAELACNAADAWPPAAEAVLGDAITRLERRGIIVLLSGIKPQHDGILSTLGVAGHSQSVIMICSVVMPTRWIEGIALGLPVVPPE